MKKIFKKHIFVTTIIVSSLILASCEKEVDVDLRSVESRLVIEGKVVKDSLATVRLTTTKDFYDDNNFLPVTDAVVVITDDAGHGDTLAYDAISKLYRSSTIYGIEKRTYNLSVKYKEIEYTSTSTMPPLVPLDSVTLAFLYPGMDYPFPYVHLKDPLGEENQYYRFPVYVNGKRIVKDDAAYSAEYNDGQKIVLPITVFPENNSDEDPIKQGDTILIESQCIDKGAFLYFSTLADIDNSLNNPTTNIKGGALGYFSAYSVDRKSIIAKWDEK
ncbi:MAG: DUF4249 domain-containing protein [Dysgonomonas sp.]